MRLQKYINKQGTGKKMEGTMIGYKVDFSVIKKTSDYIKSWLDRYNVDYKQNQNIHVTVAQIVGKYSKDKIIRVMQNLPANYTINPKELKLLYGHNVDKYFITIELKKNNKYRKSHDMVREELPEVKTFPEGMKPHISLFMLDTSDMDPYMWNEITQRNIKLPKIKVNKLQLFNNKFLPEFLLKK
jgi:hypothetical protein